MADKYQLISGMNGELKLWEEIGSNVYAERTSTLSAPEGWEIAQGTYSDKIGWSLIGYNGAVSTAEEDVWGGSSVYVFPTAEMGMEITSSDNTADIGTVIHDGTATGGSTTTLIDTAANFTGGTSVAVGDAVLINKAASAPEFGYVTAVTSATQLAIAGGFSRGGVPTGRTYHIVDKSAYAGAQAVQVCYLDSDFANGCEIVVLNGTAVVATAKTDIYRVNALRVIAAGANGVSTGAISLRHLDNTPVYSIIPAGFTRSRDAFYTVPAGKVLYITEFTFSYGYAANQTYYARVYLRVSQFENTIGDFFKTPGIFYPYGETICANSSQLVTLDIPKKIMSGVDIKISTIAAAAGVVTATARGWIGEE